MRVASVDRNIPKEKKENVVANVQDKLLSIQNFRLSLATAPPCGYHATVRQRMFVSVFSVKLR